MEDEEREDLGIPVMKNERAGNWRQRRVENEKIKIIGGELRIERAGNWRLGMGGQRGVEKEN